MASYTLALLASLAGLILLALAAVAGIDLARGGLETFWVWFVQGLAYAAPVVFVLSWSKLPGSLPRLVVRLDPARVADQQVDVGRHTVFEVPAIVLTAVGMVGLAFFSYPIGIDCPPRTVGPYSHCTIAQMLGTTDLFGIPLTGYVVLYLLAHPLWALVWVLD